VRGRLLWLLFVVATAGFYPLLVLAGGTPHFPHRSECVHPAREGTELIAVFGRFHERGHATVLLKRVSGLGFKGSKIEGDPCGFLRVIVPHIPSLEVGKDFVAEAQRVGLHPVLESVSRSP
jgi:hypothetical protein